MSEARRETYVLELGRIPIAVREVSGYEELSRPFKIEARATVPPDLDLDPDRFLRSNASLSIVRDGETLRRIDGVVTEMWTTASAKGAPDVHIVLEPRIALAKHRVDARVYRDLSAPEIAAEVLGRHGVELTLRLREQHPKMAYCVQHRESDLDFVSRLLEYEGIAWFPLDGKIVLADAPAAWEPLPETRSLQFRAAGGQEHHADTVTELSQRARMTVGKVSLRDFHPDRPSLDMRVEIAGPTPAGPEHYDYPGEYAVPEEGKRQARLRAEAFAADHAALLARSTSARVFPGCVFELRDAPAPVPEGDVLVTRVTHAWNATDGSFATHFEALEVKVPWRPMRATRAPRLTNPITGFVTGPKGADVHTDALGRVKVRMMWDRRSPMDDTCSDWVPVIQDNTGHSCGIPRVGWEVLVHFLEGDPDRPVVLGRLYNGLDQFPEALPENKTVSALQSVNSPGRDGSNKIRMDDTAGAEQMQIQAEKDQEIVVANDKRTDITSAASRTISGNETVTIGNDAMIAVGGDASSDVAGSQVWAVAGKRQVSVAKGDSVGVKGNHKIQIGGTHVRKIRTDDKVGAKNIEEKVGAVILEASVGENATKSAKSTVILVGGAIVEIARKDKKEDTKLARAELVGGLLFSKSKGPTSIKAMKNLVTAVGGTMMVDSSGPIEIGASNVTLSIGASGYFQSPTITLEVGSSQIVLGGGVVLVKAANVTIEATAAGALHHDAGSLL